jgi:hypothetical protein
MKTETDWLKEHLRTLIRSRERMHELPRELEQEFYAITDDIDLTGESRDIYVRQARDKARSAFRKHDRAADHAFREADDLINRVRVTRKVDVGAQSRVRSLLQQGFAPSRVRQRARDLKDDEMLAALRTELLYFGDGKNWADAEETMRLIGQDLVEVGLPHEQEFERLALEIGDIVKPLPEIREFAAKYIEGTARQSDLASSRLRMGFALSQADADGGGDA